MKKMRERMSRRRFRR